VIRELVTKPAEAVIALIELPGTINRSLKEANEVMEVSRRQLETIESQTGNALEQVERMNDLLSRVVRLTEPIEKAQRGGEYFAGGLKRAIHGLERAIAEAEAEATEGGPDLSAVEAEARELEREVEALEAQAVEVTRDEPAVEPDSER
jgi:chromosome segregation ATPase